MKNQIQNQTLLEVQEIISQFLEIPEEQITSQIKPNFHGFDAAIRAGDKTFLVEFKSSSTRANLLSALLQLVQLKNSFSKEAIPIVVVPFMGNVGARFCNENGLSWVDLCGNAHIKAPGLIVRAEGKPNRFKKAGRPRNPFAPKSARIVRQLLIEPKKFLTQRELSKKTGLSEGFTSIIVRKLEHDGLISRDAQGAVRPQDPNHLLDAWHDAYDFHKNEIIKGHIAARSGEDLLHLISSVLRSQKIDYAVTGLGAAWLQNRFANFRLTTVYLRYPPNQDLLRELAFREDERGANTWLVIPNDEGVFQGTNVLGEIRCVHPVQTYLDLKGHPERSDEAASKLRQDKLNWEWDAG